jgi:hypothetical protein
MRWTKWMTQPARIAHMVVGLALVILAEPGVEVVVNGLKWT